MKGSRLFYIFIFYSEIPINQNIGLRDLLEINIKGECCKTIVTVSYSVSRVKKYNKTINISILPVTI